MDLLDFWKCHLCEHANYLFLMVPYGASAEPIDATAAEFATVAKRLRSFFVPRNYTNVRGLFIFGYDELGAHARRVRGALAPYRTKNEEAALAASSLALLRSRIYEQPVLVPQSLHV